LDIPSNYDVIIAGAGSFGMSTGYQLAKAGVRVLLIDANDPPHSEGSHHGTTRIVRCAYTMGASYVKLALRAMELWKELENESASIPDSLEHGPRSLYSPIGVISIGPIGSLFIQSKTESCITFGIPHQRITAAELQVIWPGLSIPHTMEGLYESEAGVLYSENIIHLYRELALRHGAELLVHTKVLEIEQTSSGRQLVRTSAGEFTAQKVLVSGGAWSSQLLPELNNIIHPIRKPIAWFEAPQDRYGIGTLPAFIINNGGDEEYFGFPDLDNSGLKIGRHDGGQIVIPGQPIAPFGAFDEDEEELRRALDLFLPGVGGLIQGQTCLYEHSPGERLLLGQVPGRSGVWFAGGGSGHGFKFTSAIGEAMSIALTKGQEHTSLDWHSFTLKGVN
jgi:N-methyl-L-tryptophan oxidase